MNKKTRTAIGTAASVAVIVIIIVAAAGAYLYFSSSSPSSTTNIKLINFTDPANSWMQWAATQFSQSHPGVNITVIGQSFGSYIQTEVTAEKTGSSTYDILGFTSTSSHSVLPYLVDLGASSYNASDIPAAQMNFGGLFQNATTGRTMVAGLAWDSATFTLFYRTDVFDNATLSAEFQSQYGVPLDPHQWTSWNDALYADHFLVDQKHVFQYGILTDAQEAHDIIDTFPALWGYNYSRSASLNGGTQGGITNYNIMFSGMAMAGHAPLPSFNNSMGVQTLQLY